MGIHVGAARKEDNPVTGRADYFGPVVNIAARTEAAAHVGGVVCITQAVLDELGDEGLQRVGAPHVVAFGAAEMKGITSPPPLHGLFPRRLAFREAHVTQARTERLRPALTGDSTHHEGQPMVLDLFTARLALSPATVACVKGQFRHLSRAANAAEALNRFAAAVDDAVERTGGGIAALCGNQAVAAWNAAGRACAQHATQAARAAGALRGTVPADLFRYGAASGPVVHGDVGGGRRRHVLLYGPCIELAARAAAAAGELGAAAIAAGCGGHPCAAQDPGMRGLMRAVGVWPLADGTDPVVVWQLDVDALSGEQGFGILSLRRRGMTAAGRHGAATNGSAR